MNIRDKLNDLIISKKIYIYSVVTLLIGILFMLFSGNSGSKEIYDATDSKTHITTAISEYQTDIESKLKTILSKAEGVGEIDIIINYVSDSKSTPISNNGYNEFQQHDNDSSTLQNNKSEIEGVLIVVEGADNEEIAYNIKDAVSGFLGIPIHKVRILNMK